MEMSKLPIILVVVLMNLHVRLTMIVNEDKIPTLVELVKSVNNGNIFPFCQELQGGADKYACRINQFPAVGFLLCKKAIIVDDACENVLEMELKGLKILRDYGVNTVEVLSPIMANVVCPDPEKKGGKCCGFFEKWVDKNEGRFFHVRVYIDDKTLKDKMTKIIKMSSKEKVALEKTIKDLTQIEKFMTNTNNKEYIQCICDLQGFFIFNGGFRVSDTEGIEVLHVNKECTYGGPKAREFLAAVRKMIEQVIELNKL